MRDISAIEIGVAARELKETMLGSRLRKFYDLGDGAFKLSLYKQGAATLLYVKLLKTINATQYTEPADQATPFAMGMRKRLENAVIDAVYQKNADRILVFEINHGEFLLILEMFGKGNIILIDKELKIELCYKKISQKDRAINAGLKYVFPQQTSSDLLELGEKQIAEIVKEVTIEKNVMSSLSSKFGIGPLYLEDIIIRSGIDPKAKELTEANKSSLVSQLSLLKERLQIEKPRIYMEAEKPKEYAVCSIKKYEALEVKEFDTFSAMLDYLYLGERTEIQDPRKASHLKELNLNIEKQTELTESLAKDSEQFALYGHALLRMMNQINALTTYLNSNRRATLKEVTENFPALKIKELDLKNKIVKIQIDEK